MGELTECHPSIKIVHVCGSVVNKEISKSRIECIPTNPAPFGHMSFTLGHVGPKPIVNLQAAGLRVGANLARKRNAGVDFRQAMETVPSSSIAMDFSEEFKQEHGYYD